MTWEPELDELRRREALAEQLRGADKVERQHHFGKLRCARASSGPSTTARRTLVPAPPTSGYRP